MKKRMVDLENQIALQNADLNKISNNSNQKEEQLNNDITDYINQINELKNEMEVLNNIITNLTEEKENNAIKISSLLHENEKLKQNIKNNNNLQNNENEKMNNKKYEEIILKLKKNMLSLKEENKSLEEVILKQESEVSQLSSKVIEVEKVLIQKDKELQESIEYSAKLTSSINFHKNEIIKIKQKQSQNEVNKTDKNSEIIMNLQKELQNMKKNLEMKENKLNILSGNNKNLQDKLNKLTQIIKNELNMNNGNTNHKINSNANTKYSNKNKSNIHSSYNNYHTNKMSISKPQSQLKNKTTRVSVPLNSVSSNIPKNINIINNNIENYKESKKNFGNNKNTQYKRQNIEDKKLYIISKQKIKSKTPGKLISSKNQLQEDNTMKKYINNNLNRINNDYKTGIKISKSNINEKYKKIESKYKEEKKEVTKEDTLFNEDDINSMNINKEIINPHNKMEEEIDPIPILNNMNEEILKPKKEGRNKAQILYSKNILEQQSSYASQEKEFPIIESYCMLVEKEKDNKKEKNKQELNCCLTNNSNSAGYNLANYMDKDRGNESKLEAKQVEDLKECVNKILNEF